VYWRAKKGHHAPKRINPHVILYDGGKRSNLQASSLCGMLGEKPAGDHEESYKSVGLDDLLLSLGGEKGGGEKSTPHSRPRRPWGTLVLHGESERFENGRVNWKKR